MQNLLAGLAVSEQDGELEQAVETNAVSDLVGRRRRAHYTIIAKGRRESARWLAEPGQGPVLEFEALLKVFLAEHGTRRDLLATLAGVEDCAGSAPPRTRKSPTATSPAPGSPGRTAQLVLVGRYLADLAQLTGRWAQWATEVVEGWPEDLDAATPAWDALREIAAREQAKRILIQRPAPTRRGPGPCPNDPRCARNPACEARQRMQGAAPARTGVRRASRAAVTYRCRAHRRCCCRSEPRQLTGSPLDARARPGNWRCSL